MRRDSRFENDFDHRPWFVVPVRPGAEKSWRRWNYALIAALAFIVIGIFAMTVTSEFEASASNTRPVAAHSVPAAD